MNNDARKILLLEDEKDIARIIKIHLERFGYDVTSVLEGTEWLAAAQSGKYDICLLNVYLPGL